MRVAFISTILGYPWGGADVLWTRSAAAALCRGHAVLVAVSPAVAAHARVIALRSAGAVVHERSGSTREGGRRSRWRQATQRLLRSPRSVVGALDLFRPECVVVCQGGVFDFLVEDGLNRWLAESGCSFSLICQANDERSQISPADQVIARQILARARCTLFVSSHNRDHAARQVGAPVPRAFIVPNPIELSPGELPVTWPAEESPRIAVVARLESEVKGLDVLLDALRELPLETDWQVDLFGRGPDAESLRARADELGLTSRVRICGYVPDVKSIWASHHCLLLSSRSEGCALAMLEAMACGRPVITTDVGGASDWVKDGVNGFVCPPGDARALAQCLQRALEHFSHWPEMGAASDRIIQRQHLPTPESLVLDSALAHSA